MFKRILDFSASVLALLVLALPMLIIALLVRIKLGSPVLFRQMRPGFRGKLFQMVKFRTMTDVCDSTGSPLADAERLHPFGRLLRRTSLDELPELFNVIKGDMSLVGPRPLLVEYLLLYDAIQARRHDVRPGISGWSQVNGRNDQDWETQLAQDVWYVDNCSLWLDFRILLSTVGKVLRAEGVSQKGQATRTRFMGSAKNPSNGGEGP